MPDEACPEHAEHFNKYSNDLKSKTFLLITNCGFRSTKSRHFFISNEIKKSVNSICAICMVLNNGSHIISLDQKKYCETMFMHYGKTLVNQCCYCIDLWCKVSCNQFCCYADLLFVVIDLISLGISQESKILYNQIHNDKKETLLANIV